MDDFTRYIPHTEDDIRTMLEFVGAKKVEDLFEMIPKEYRLAKPLDLPEPLSEPDLLRHLQGLQSVAYSSFLGAGAYHHFIPSVISALISRSEFYTRDQSGDAAGDL
jgi:glycine dehydrogenase subunit 1